MTQRILRALVVTLLVAGGIVATPPSAAHAAGVTFSVEYQAWRGVGCQSTIYAKKGGVTIAEGVSTAVTASQPPNWMYTWDYTYGGPQVKLQVSVPDGRVLTYPVPDRVGTQYYGEFSREIFYPIYRWRIVADNQASGWVVPGSSLNPNSVYCS